MARTVAQAAQSVAYEYRLSPTYKPSIITKSSNICNSKPYG